MDKTDWVFAGIIVLIALFGGWCIAGVIVHQNHVSAKCAAIGGEWTDTGRGHLCFKPGVVIPLD